MQSAILDDDHRHQQIANAIHAAAISRDELLGAIDLGSNSFHLAIGRLDHGEVRKVASISEKKSSWQQVWMIIISCPKR